MLLVCPGNCACLCRCATWAAGLQAAQCVPSLHTPAPSISSLANIAVPGGSSGAVWECTVRAPWPGGVSQRNMLISHRHRRQSVAVQAQIVQSRPHGRDCPAGCRSATNRRGSSEPERLPCRALQHWRQSTAPALTAAAARSPLKPVLQRGPTHTRPRSLVELQRCVAGSEAGSVTPQLPPPPPSPPPLVCR